MGVPEAQVAKQAADLAAAVPAASRLQDLAQLRGWRSRVLAQGPGLQGC